MNIKRRKVVTVSFSLIILTLAVAFFLSPYSTALLKSKSHFIKHPGNDKVLYEPGAENYADSIASYLMGNDPEATKLQLPGGEECEAGEDAEGEVPVEEAHGRPGWVRPTRRVRCLSCNRRA